MKLFSVRHGETEWNALNKICGRTDIALNEVGMEQARAMAQKVRELGVEVIICSPMLRARQTAQFIAQECGLEIITDGRLIEQNYGIYEGEDRHSEAFLANKRNFAYRYPGGESMMDVARRVYELLEDVRVRYRGRNVVLVSHGGVCRVINTYFHDMTNDEFFHFIQSNAEVMEYEM